MFESICIARADFVGDSIDFGRLAEALVFYQKVHFLADHETFTALVRTCGSDTLLELCEMGSLQIHYAENTLGVATRNASTASERNGLITAKAQGHSFLSHATKFFEQYFGRSGKGLNRTLRRFARLVQPYEYQTTLLDRVNTDLIEHDYIKASVRGLLMSLAPEYVQPDSLVFDIARLPEGDFQVQTNLNFDEANHAYHMHVSPARSTLSAAFIIASILGTRGNLEKASETSSDLALGPVSSIMGANKIAKLFLAHDKNQRTLAGFMEMVVSDSRAIAQAVNGRQRTFADVLKLVQEAQKFKKWIRNQQESSDLRIEYCRQVSRIGWAEKLPPKTVRWLLTNAISLGIGAKGSPTVAALIGLGISAADAFLLEKLLKGWHPNQFVEGPLKDFIKIEGL
jgi:hypothetical protein